MEVSWINDEWKEGWMDGQRDGWMDGKSLINAPL